MLQINKGFKSNVVYSWRKDKNLDASLRALARLLHWSASPDLYACTPVRRTATLLDAKWRNPMTPFWSSRSCDWTQISVLRFPLNESVRRIIHCSEPKKNKNQQKYCTKMLLYCTITLSVRKICKVLTWYTN